MGYKMTSISLKIEDYIRSIPRGKVSTYGRIAKMVGLPNGARLVARVLHARSSVAHLPWHRVLGQSRKFETACIVLQDIGFDEQRVLLLSEGIDVSENGDVNLSHFGWHNFV